MPKVALLKCDEYSNELLKDALFKGLADIETDTGVFKGARVGVKPNLLMGAPIDRAVVTHPKFFRAAVQVVKHFGGTPVLMENPAVAPLEKIAKKAGYTPIIEEEGVEIADVKPTATLKYPDASTYKRIEISKAFFDVDVIVNLPKFKTHGVTYITGAVKNLFGSIPGLDKSRMHMKAPTSESFSEFLLDLYGAFLFGFDPPKPIIHMMDAVIGQEGEGPGPAGTPRKIGAVIVGENGLAVDCAAVRTAGLDIRKAPTIVSGFARPYGLKSEDDIEIRGERPESFDIQGYRETRHSIFSNVMRGPITSGIAKKFFTEKPVPDPKKCTLCYQCMTICPAGAVSAAAGRKKTPRYDYDKCIRCFCCMEICPDAAISMKKGKFQWVMRV